MEVVRERVLGEEVHLGRTSAGLAVRVCPMPRAREAVAVLTFRYGGADLVFRDGGGEAPRRSPEGTAHYLEHKLFEAPELKVFDRFSARGARVNAMTGYSRTGYFFSCTDRFAENLGDLLSFPASPHITAENVEKERGIIAQEIRMYLDDPDHRAFYRLMEALFHRHPARHPVAGTVESIAAVTPEELLRCHAAFYRAGNAWLTAAGPVDPAEVFAAAEAAPLAPGGPPEREDVEEPPETAEGEVRMTTSVRRPRALVGFKETAERLSGEALLRREYLTNLLLDLLFGASSEEREALYRAGLIDDSFGAFHASEEGFACTVVSGETDEPARLRDAVAGILERALRRPFEAADLERVRRKVLGAQVRVYDAPQSTAFHQSREAAADQRPFRTLDLLASFTPGDLQARLREHLDPAALAAVLLEPEEPAAS